MAVPNRYGRRNVGNAGSMAASGPRAGSSRDEWCEQILRCAAQSGMTRADFIRTAGIAGAGVAAASMGLGNVARAAPGDINPDPSNIEGNPGNATISVYPTDTYPKDVENVQWALENVYEGGTVILKQYAAGTSNPLYFNFGTTGTVSITKSVTLQGEFTGFRKPLSGVGYGGWIQEGTTIKGGTAPVRVPRLGALNGPSFTIKDIIFNGPRNRAIGCGTSSGYNEISGCKIVNLMVGPLLGAPTGAFWMIIHGGTDENGINGLTGTLKIKNNFFGKPVNPLPNSTEPDPNSLANSINSLMHVSNCNLQLEISGNEVENCVWAGLLVMLNKGYSVITRNKINKTRSFLPGSGIGVGIYPSNSFFITNYSYEGGAEVTANEITIGSPPPSGTQPDALSTTNSSAISIADYPPNQFPALPGYPKQVPAPATYVVSGNQIMMHRNYANNGLNPSAVYFGGAASNVTCYDNVMGGEAQYGFLMGRTVLPPFMAAANESSFVAENHFYGNSLEGFSAGAAQVSLDAFSHDNYFGPDATNGIPGNMFGNVLAGAKAGIWCRGNNNHFEDEQFMFDYLGWTVTSKDPVTGEILAYTGPGYVLFDAGSYNNKVVALKGPSSPYGMDLCKQVLDLTGDNKAPGYNKCEPY